MGILDGKVALITGAGGGLGRAYALAMAQQGARVVVNDLGGARDGVGQGSLMADQVVDAIKALGGQAVANYGSVADAEQARTMVEQAIEAFGQIDIVVNNAGILRDKTLLNQTEEMWDVVVDVHMKGTFLVTQAAVAAMMRAARGGRIVNTTSYAGLKGNFGQANYGAAKAGIAGFTKVVALETGKFGITCNAIAPLAKTRLTEEIAMIPEQLQPDDIAPLVVWLASDGAGDVTGRVFGAHGSHYFEYLTELTSGVDLAGQRWTPQMVGERFAEIVAVAQAAVVPAAEGGDDRVKSLFVALPGVFNAERARDWAATIAFEVKGAGVYGLKIGGGKAEYLEAIPDQIDGKVTFDSTQTLLDMTSGKLAPEQAFMSGKLSSSNMGVLMKFGKCFDLAQAAQGRTNANGVSVDESGTSSAAEVQAVGLNVNAVGKRFRQKAEFVRSEDIVTYIRAVDDSLERYAAVAGQEVGPPLFAVRAMFGVLGAALTDGDLNADLMRLVHGEQDMRFFRPLRPWDLVAPRGEIAAIEHKSSGHLIQVRQSLLIDGEVACEAVSGLFVRSAGLGKSGNGGETKGPAVEGAKEAVARDIVYEESQCVAPDQPARYAVASGDHNPLHLDADVARAAGLKNVILHGLCTMAFATRAVVQGVCGGESERLRRFKVRFARPVYPEMQLTTRIWKESETGGVTTYGLETVADDGTLVLSHGLVEVAS